MPKHATSSFEQHFTLLNDGLSQTSTRSVTYPGDVHGPSEITVTTTLPPFVLPSYWNEFQLSKDDVQQLSDFLPAQLLWLSCLVHGADVSASCLKPSFARVDEVLISSRTSAIRTLITHQNVKFTNTRPVLDTTSAASLEHIPPLPSKEVHESEIPFITKLLFPRLRAFEVCDIQGLFTWQDRQYLPVKLEGDAIYLQRATLLTNYERSKKRQKYGYATVPFIVKTPNEVLYALCEDGVLLSPKQ